MKNLADLQAECAALALKVETSGRANKEPYIAALRDHHWRNEHHGSPLPPQVQPMLLGSWDKLGDDEARALEEDHHSWIVQPKLDGVRALVQIEGDRVRITSRTVSEVTYRLAEFQGNLPHLCMGLNELAGTALDGELVCPTAELDTGNTVAASALQATTAILATSPDNARRIQDSQSAHVRFHVFDILRLRGEEVISRPLVERQELLAAALRQAANPFIEPVPSYVVNKVAVHDRIIAAGGEGTVWKRADAPYEPGRRVGHWIKRKRGIEVEAIVTGFKPGTKSHTGSVGALEFGVRTPDGCTRPIAWVSNLTDAERIELTASASAAKPTLASRHLGRRAIISGQDLSAKARRLRHARVVRWIDHLV